MNLKSEKIFSKRLKVLVVEDNQVDRMVLESMLADIADPRALKITPSLREAFELLDNYPFDVVILDLNLPDCNGEETLHKLNDRYPNVPIVVNTGAYEEDLGLQALAKGAQDFLVKGKYTAYILHKVLLYSIERKRLENQLTQADEQLQDTKAQLVHAEKMKVIGNLASGIAHEVRNPLATILYGITYLAESVKSDDKNFDAVVTNIKEAVGRADSIITDLLDFSSVTTLNKQQHDVRLLVDKALSLVNHQLEKRCIRVERSFSDAVPAVMIDRNRIEQVFVNVILNAAYAMEKGGVLTISADGRVCQEQDRALHSSAEIKSGDTIAVVTFADTGCGIPPDKLDVIFDPFFTTRQTNGGIGLGLSVSRNIMDLHHGSIHIDNQPQGGVRATLIFKVA